MRHSRHLTRNGTGGSPAQIRFCCSGSLDRCSVWRMDVNDYYGACCSWCENGAGIDPIHIMVGSPNLPTQRFVDYSFIYPSN
jgi:hypothetical protein